MNLLSVHIDFNTTDPIFTWVDNTKTHKNHEAQMSLNIDRVTKVVFGYTFNTQEPELFEAGLTLTPPGVDQGNHFYFGRRLRLRVVLQLKKVSVILQDSTQLLTGSNEKVLRLFDLSNTDSGKP